ncbi:hypothetical protein [Allorhodopirellula heiligendammensis]|uniref:Uncharacterized protein n=1 Tax=Allorhodopirellula heiligendammensis TaxID=2714739 RepID=A0A5C6C6T2_9BACT|nr:hypothetical protein [Allorhodopirellula heiligendammensis]TWU19838.1 hypothetical protein Poly21_20160 [Allorhodopirellula heiligendammensis]
MITVRKTIAVTTSRRHKIVDEKEAVPGTLPRITRLMALAIRFDELLRSGRATGLQHIAEIGHVSQPRVSQILSLTLLAPDIQEELLFLPRMKKGKPQISEKLLRPLTMEMDWKKQRVLWAELRSDPPSKPDRS